MTRVSVPGLKAEFNRYLKATAQGPVVVTRNRKAVAVLLAVSDDDELERLLMAHSPKLCAILDEAERQLDAGAGIPHEQFWREVEERARAREVKNGTKKRKRAKATDGA